MKAMKILLIALVAISLLACLTACNEPAESSAPDSSAPVTTTTTTQADDGKITYTVTVTDEGGNPVSGALIQLCADSCFPTATNEQGVATWSLEEEEYKISFLNTETPATGYTYVDPDETNFYFEDGETEATVVLKAVA